MKRICSILLTLILIMTMIPASVFAASFNDTANHWADSSIERWSDSGVVGGKGDGFFDPDGLLTRAEAAQIFSKLLGLNKEADISRFKDVKNTDWYKTAIAKCVEAGIMSGRSDGTMDPNGNITREEFMAMYARAISITSDQTAAEAKSNLQEKGFVDTSKLSNWAADSVNVLVEKGFVNGLTETTLAPTSNINRASVTALLDKSITTYVGTDNKESTVEAKSNGITLIASSAVKTITGDADIVVIAAGAELYNETTGEVDHNDVQIESSKMTLATVEGENITVTLKSNTVANDAVVTKTGEKSEIVIDSSSSVGDLQINADNAKATVSGKVDNVAIENTAENVTVDTKSGATITTVDNKAENTTITGNGTVGEVKSSEDVTVETKSTKVSNTNENKEIAVTDSTGKENTVATTPQGTAAQTTVNGTAASSGSGSGSGHTHSYGSDWTSDAVYHWHTSTCGHNVTSEMGEHDTNGENGTCSKCGYAFNITIGDGETTTLSAISGITWVTSDGAIAIVSDGAIIAKGEGYTSITAITSNSSLIYNITVTAFHGGSGTTESPYQIYNAKQWINAGVYSYYYSIMNFELVNDIDFNYEVPNGWAGDGFTLNGNGHTMKNATARLFAQNWTYNLYLKDITLYNCVSDYSLICGYGSYNVSTKQEFINVDVVNCTARGGSFFLPWVYDNYTTNFIDCDIANSTVNNDITCQGFVAAFVGNSKSTVTVDHCSMQATIISSNPIVAGFLGSNGTIKNSSIMPGTIIKQNGSNSASAFTGSGNVTTSDDNASTCYATIIAASSAQVNKNGFVSTVAYSSTDLGFDANSFVINNDGSVAYDGTVPISKLKIYQTVTTNRLRDGVYENGGFPTPVADSRCFTNIASGSSIEGALDYVTSVKNVATEPAITDKLDCLISSLPQELEFNSHGFVFNSGVLYLNANQGENYTSDYFAGTLKNVDTVNAITVTVYYSVYDENDDLLGTVTGSYSVELNK